jgi:hypothetical protein
MHLAEELCTGLTCLAASQIVGLEIKAWLKLIVLGLKLEDQGHIKFHIKVNVKVIIKVNIKVNTKVNIKST